MQVKQGDKEAQGRFDNAKENLEKKIKERKEIEARITSLMDKLVETAEKHKEKYGMGAKAKKAMGVMGGLLKGLGAAGIAVGAIKMLNDFAR